jgi:uncharacterized protein YecT (DUF1311 family)
MVPFKFEATTVSDVVRLTDAQIRTLHCVAPCNFETGEQQSVLLHELGQKWRDRIRGSLRQSYDDVRNIVAVDGTVTLQAEISAFIYPAYVGWYAVGQKHRYVICDALTGEVRLPSKVGYYAKKAIGLLLMVAAAIAVLVGLLLVIGAIFGERNAGKSAVPPQNISRRAAEPNVVSAAQSATPATAITPVVESRPDLGQTQRSEATSVPVQNEPSASPVRVDCANASTMIERIVCGDTVLSNLDVALSENYDALLASPVDKAAYEALKDSQRKWITERDRCESSACLTTAYRARLRALCEHPASVGMGLVCGL